MMLIRSTFILELVGGTALCCLQSCLPVCANMGPGFKMGLLSPHSTGWICLPQAQLPSPSLPWHEQSQPDLKLACHPGSFSEALSNSLFTLLHFIGACLLLSSDQRIPNKMFVFKSWRARVSGLTRVYKWPQTGPALFSIVPHPHRSRRS